MAAETLLREVDEKRRKTIEQLESEYKAKREEVAKRAAEQRAYILESAKAQAAALAQRERIRITGAAKLQSKKMAFDATEKMLEHIAGDNCLEQVANVAFLPGIRRLRPIGAVKASRGRMS